MRRGPAGAYAVAPVGRVAEAVAGARRGARAFAGAGCVAIASLTAILAAASTAAAQVHEFAGSYVRTADQSDDIERAIAATVSRMSFLTRPVARSRLRRTNLPHETVVITVTASEVAISFDGAAPTRTAPDGTPAAWTRPGGEHMPVSTRLEDGRLIQTFHAEDGQRRNTFELDDDGSTLIVRVEVTSPRLPEPVRYTLRFTRRE